jgi:hypothetical protein
MRSNEVRLVRALLGIVSITAILLVCARVARADEPCEGLDSDGDGICDEIEIESGTSPFRVDTDGDSIPDGEEDLDHDGVVDEGESDPRVPGLFPGASPHIPEPLVFDLVRALGAKRNELEANTLIVTRFRAGKPLVDWAPEVEWAIVDDVAIELELPLLDRELEAVKVAFQVTLPDRTERFTHGVQLIEEYVFDAKAAKTTLLYLFGGRVGRVALFSMIGARAITPMSQREHYDALLNPSIYLDVNERLTLGLETNLALSLAASPNLDALVLPQLHVQLSRHVRAQLGAGVQVVDGIAYGVGAMRWVME